ncbi:MAG TPA: hypothetical protein VM940_11450 [Chthoniobacterales bacterium]|jgi:hypothetical protein|nr:hypothetical protein [Chthoniobacterales bacterium]
MAVAPEHYRAARIAVPRLPLPAILAFAVAGLGGSIFLAYSSFSHGEARYSIATTQDAPVYDARAVPFEPAAEDPAQRAASIARALVVSLNQSQRSTPSGDDDAELGPAENSVVITDAGGEFRGFPGLPAFTGTNNYLMLAASSFVGISGQTGTSGFAAPDAETLTAAPVPEASTWVCGAALIALVAGRGIHANRVRNRRRD